MPAALVASVANYGTGLLAEEIARRAGVISDSRLARAGRVAKRARDIVTAAHFGYQVYKKVKRMHDQVGGPDEPMTQRYPAAGQLNIVQRGYSKGRYGRKPKKGSRLALKLINSTLQTGIARWQRIGQYETQDTSFAGPGTLTLAHWSPGDRTSDTAYVGYPVNIFDLTSLSYNRDGVEYNGSVGYMLGRSATTQQYYWDVIPGQSPKGAAGDPDWYYERLPNGTAEGAVPTLGQRVYTPWVDVRLNLYGARKQTTTFWVGLVQFNDRAWDPEVNRFQVPAVNNMRSSEEQSQYDAFWDQFLQPKVYNPMHPAGHVKNNIFKVLCMKKYTITPDNSTNLDDQQPNINVKFFQNLNRVCKYDWSDDNAIPVGDTLSKITKDIELEPQAVGNQARYNQFLGKNAKAYVHPRAKVFLMVCCESFFKARSTAATPFSFSAGGVVTDGNDYVPAMDIVIRKKVVYDDT